MKKRIALEDKKEWCFEASESVIYYNARKSYLQVEHFQFLQFDDIEEGHGLEFDLSEIALPNLKHIIIHNGKSKQPYLFINKLQDESLINVNGLTLLENENEVPLQQWISKCENLKDAGFFIMQNVFFPFDLSRSFNLQQLRVDLPKLKQIPKTIFKCHSLNSLYFEYAANITVVDDEIENLINLKSYSHSYASFTYISPKLFKLPNLEELNFSFTGYDNPPSEIFEAIKDLKQRKPLFNFHSQGGNWFREIWDQV